MSLSVLVVQENAQLQQLFKTGNDKGHVGTADPA